MGRVVLSNLNPQSVIHPEDRSAIINVVDNIPGVRTALKSVGEFYGKLTAIDYMGNGVVANKESMPELHKHFVDTCNVGNHSVNYTLLQLQNCCTFVNAIVQQNNNC